MLRRRMELLNPAGLWWLAALPLLVLPYLVRERPKRRVVAAVFLFRGIDPGKRLRLAGRPRFDPLFLLQLLILLAAVAALVRPALQAETTRSALVIDDTASLGAASGSRTRFDLLRDEARAAVSADASEVWDVYALAPRPAILEENAGRDDVLSLLERREPTSCADPADAALSSFLAGLADGGYARVHVVTDRPAPATGTVSAPFTLRTVGAPTQNLAITGFSLLPGGFATAGSQAKVTVAAFTEAAAKVSVGIADGRGNRLAARELEIPPGESHTVTLDVPEADALVARLSITDALPLDDTATLTAHAGGKRRVLLVGRAGSRLESVPGLDVETIPPDEYDPAKARGRDLAIFHLTAPAEPPAVPALYVLPPPASFLPLERGPTDAPEISFPAPGHPAVRYLNPGALRPRRTLAFEPPAGWQPLAVTTRGAAVLARAGESPAAVVGFDLFPFLGERNRPVSILTLNLLSWLANGAGGRSAADCSILGTAESDLRSPPALPLPDAADTSAEAASMTVTRPLWPWIAAAALALLLFEGLLQRRRGRGGPLALVLRLGVAALLVAAVLDPQRSLPGEPGKPILLVDQSASVTPDARSRAMQGLDAFPVETTLPFGDARETNLEAALATAAAGAKPGSPLVVVTDGWENTGDARSVLPLLKSRDVRVYPVAVSQGLPPNVRVASLSLPPESRAGNPARASVLVENRNAAAVEGRLILRRGDRVLSRKSVRLVPGENVLAENVLVTGKGLVEFAARFEAADAATNAVREDDEARAWVSVRGRRGVLLLGGSRSANRYVERALGERGFDVDARAPGGSLPDLDAFGAVLLNDVALGDLPRGAAGAIRAFVRGGGGLAMIGGTRSFGLGGYGGSAIEEALPVKAKPREREEPRSAVALIIDKSGSMREERRMVYAIESARQLVERMRPSDLLTVIGFDRRAFVIVPLREIRDVRADFESRISRLRPIGGTRLYPALVEAQRALVGTEARRRHVIVLSDGLSEDAETSSGQRVYYDLALALSQGGVTVSTIALGREADARFLERLASFGRGAFHQTDDPTNLPELVIGGLEGEKGKERTFREERIRALPSRDSAIVGEIARADPTWPPVLGLVETELKRGARLDVATPDATPLLASWSYGEGRSVAFATDASGRWSDPWIRWNEWSRLWGSIVGWLVPEGAETDAAYAVGYDDGVLTVVYTRFDEDPAGALTATLRGPGGSETESALERVAPGHFRASFPTRTPGDYRIELKGPRGPLTRPSLGYTLAESETAERPRERPNRALLDELARRTGGVPDPGRETIRLPPPPDRRTPVTPFLLPLAMLLFVAELLARRLRGSEARAA